MRKLLSVMTALVIVVGAAGASAQPVAAATYSHACTEDIYFNPSPHPNYHIYKEDNLGTNVLRGVHGEILNVQNLFTCTNPTSSDHGTTLVLPANLQQYSGVGIVQLGLGESNYSGTSIGLHTTPVFVYTPDDGSINAPGNLITVTWAETPEYGHNYGFQIAAVSHPSTGQPVWRYIISDLTDSESWTQYRNRHWGLDYYEAIGEPEVSGSSYGGHAWYGYETTNTSGLMGRKDTDSRIYIDGQEYWHKDNGWVVHTSNTVNKLFRDRYGNVITPYDSGYPSWYTYSVTTGDGQWAAYTTAW